MRCIILKATRTDWDEVASQTPCLSEYPSQAVLNHPANQLPTNAAKPKAKDITTRRDRMRPALLSIAIGVAG